MEESMKTNALQLVACSLAILFIGQIQYAYAQETTVSPATAQGPVPDTASKNPPNPNDGPSTPVKHKKHHKFNSKEDTTKDANKAESVTTPGANPDTKTPAGTDGGGATGNNSNAKNQ